MPGITNWQDKTSQDEILSSHITGLQHAVGKMEDVLNMQVVSVTDEPLTLVADADGVYRIAEAQNKRNWLADPVPVIKRNGDVIATGFAIDYGGGAVIFDAGQAGNSFTASFSYVAAAGAVYDALDAHKSDYVPHFGFSFDTELTYDSEGNLIQVDEKEGTALKTRTTLSYDIDGNLIEVNVKKYEGANVVLEYTDTLNYVDGNLVSVERAVV